MLWRVTFGSRSSPDRCCSRRANHLAPARTHDVARGGSRLHQLVRSGDIVQVEDFRDPRHEHAAVEQRANSRAGRLPHGFRHGHGLDEVNATALYGEVVVAKDRFADPRRRVGREHAVGLEDGRVGRDVVAEVDLYNTIDPASRRQVHDACHNILGTVVDDMIGSRGARDLILFRRADGRDNARAVPSGKFHGDAADCSGPTLYENVPSGHRAISK